MRRFNSLRFSTTDFAVTPRLQCSFASFTIAGKNADIRRRVLAVCQRGVVTPACCTQDFDLLLVPVRAQRFRRRAGMHKFKSAIMRAATASL